MSLEFPQHQAWVQRFTAWWRYGIEDWLARPDTPYSLSFTCELGPPPYTITDEDGEEVKILRDNMPFGRPGAGEFGTYFIGYARSPQPLELMLENMFVGRPAGNYDRLLDFSTAVTGGLFFVPSADLLEALAERTGGL